MSKKEKELTIKDLATLIEKGFLGTDQKFIEAEKNTDKKIDDLAVMIQGEFVSFRKEVNERFDKVDERFDKVELEIAALKSEVLAIRAELTDMHAKLDFDREKLFDLERRVTQMEKKLGLHV